MLNRVELMGRLVRDPEIKSTRAGVPVANFTLAVERDFQNGGEKQTDFIDCIAWRHTAEFVSKYFQKGSLAVLAGRLEINQYTDREGNNRKSTSVNVDSIYLAGSKKTGEAAPSGRTAAPAKKETASDTFEDLTDDESDLPF